MTISKERLNEITLSLWCGDSDYQCSDPVKFKNFAHALLKAVESESDKSKPEGYYRGGAQYLRLPLVSEE